MQEALYGWNRDFGISLPFGKDMKQWLEESPAFNVERIRTPLEMLIYSSNEGNSTYLWSWELFSRLRHLNKPVELYVIPDIQHGSHLIQNPRQQLALQTRAMDWWRFWLLDEDGNSDEHADWLRLKEQHLAELKTPRPRPLRWTYTEN